MRIDSILCVLLGLVKSGQGDFEETFVGDVLKLQQVMILSRHGLRTPLSTTLTQMTPRPWPEWQEKPGDLTSKGAVLEGYMGNFFSLWFKEIGLVTSKCPSEEDFFIYANIKQRTLASAAAFVNSAFSGCNITIHHSKSNPDIIFNPVIHNTSLVFQEMVTEDMQKTLKSLSINNSYVYLEAILDYKASDLCKTVHKCDLVRDRNNVFAKSGYKPNVFGPIKIGNSVVDAFIMQYFEGFPMKNVAWNFVRSSKNWKSLMTLMRGYHDIIFNTPLLANDLSKPLLKYMRSIFYNPTSPKVSLLMGHDANIYMVLNSLRFKTYTLPDQLELVPIGGKLVFQKWYDIVRDIYLLRVDYVYQSSKQLRDSLDLDLKNPPQFQTLELKDCVKDDRGFCNWEQFEKILNAI